MFEIIADEFVEISEKAEEFPHGFTTGGHPVGCAIALKAIDVILTEGLLENVKKISPYFPIQTLFIWIMLPRRKNHNLF